MNFSICQNSQEIHCQSFIKSSLKFNIQVYLALLARNIRHIESCHLIDAMINSLEMNNIHVIMCSTNFTSKKTIFNSETNASVLLENL